MNTLARYRAYGSWAPVALAVFLASCEGPARGPVAVIAESIETHGGSAFDRVHMQWDFRGIPFEVARDNGRFRYQRTVSDSLGQMIVEVMENEGSWTEVEGTRHELDPRSRARLETAVNSVVYFGFLPFKLDDPPVRAEDLGSTMLAGQPYRKIQVTFQREGGGPDWEDRFIYWFHETDHTLDYLAYREAADVETTRFRQAINRRQVGGVLVQDYENYSGDPNVGDIATYDELFEAGDLRLISMVEFDGLEITSLE